MEKECNCGAAASPLVLRKELNSFIMLLFCPYLSICNATGVVETIFTTFVWRKFNCRERHISNSSCVSDLKGQGRCLQLGGNFERKSTHILLQFYEI